MDILEFNVRIRRAIVEEEEYLSSLLRHLLIEFLQPLHEQRLSHPYAFLFEWYSILKAFIFLPRKHLGFFDRPMIMGGNFTPVALQAKSAMILSLFFFPPLHVSPESTRQHAIKNASQISYSS